MIYFAELTKYWYISKLTKTITKAQNKQWEFYSTPLWFHTLLIYKNNVYWKSLLIGKFENLLITWLNNSYYYLLCYSQLKVWLNLSSKTCKTFSYKSIKSEKSLPFGIKQLLTERNQKPRKYHPDTIFNCLKK